MFLLYSTSCSHYSFLGLLCITTQHSIQQHVFPYNTADLRQLCYTFTFIKKLFPCEAFSYFLNFCHFTILTVTEALEQPLFILPKYLYSTRVSACIEDTKTCLFNFEVHCS